MVNAGGSVYLLIGDDSYSKERSARDLVASILGPAGSDFDLKTFRGDSATARDIIDYVSTIPFSGSCRLAIIKDLDALPDEDRARVIACAQKPPKTACLILDARSDSLAKEFDRGARHVKTLSFGALAGADLTEWIRKFIAERGKKITPDAVQLLKEISSPDLMRLSHELEKLVSYAGSADTITEEAVEALAGKSVVQSAFALTDAIQANKVDRALAVVGNLLANGSKHYEIIGLMAWHVKRLLRAKTLRMKGATETYIATSLKINRKYFDAFFRQVKGMPLETIRKKMRILLEADLDIKRSRLDAALALECAVIRLCLGS